MWTLASGWVSGSLGTLVGMARVARSEVVPDAEVRDDANDVRPPSDGPASSSAATRRSSGAATRRGRPPRPRDGEVDDALFGDVSIGDVPVGDLPTGSDAAPRVFDELVNAAQESAAKEASSAAMEASSVDAVAVAVDDEAAPSAGTPVVARTTLSDRGRAMLEFERFWWRHAGSKEQAIRETFDLSATHYYRLLNALLDQPAAAEFDPLVVGRLRRLRASRARRRAGR
jgi:hypothetical protein